MSLLMINETLSSRRLASWEDAPTPCSWPIHLAGEVLDAWRRSNDDSVVRLIQYPPLPEIARSVRGKSFVVVETDPTPFYLPFELSGLSILVRELTTETVDSIVDLAGAHARSPFVSLEVRRRRNGEYAVTALGIASTEESAEAIDIRVEQLFRALR